MSRTIGLRGSLAAALCALLLSGAPPSAAAGAAAAKPATSILIVARNRLTDPYFAGSIVLVMNNLGPAPIGIIINRPTPVPVSRLFPSLRNLVHVPDKLYFGGPVELESVWFLFRAARPPAHAIRVCEDVYVSADRRLLLRLLGRDRPMEGLRIFVGHAGWAPGQLQAEIAHGYWHLRRAEPQAIFSHAAEHPWPAPRNSTRGSRPPAAAQT